jgi:hypothetical protein
LLANAKSIALSLGMVHLDSDAQRMTLRWQIAQELVTRSIVGDFKEEHVLCNLELHIRYFLYMSISNMILMIALCRMIILVKYI